MVKPWGAELSSSSMERASGEAMGSWGKHPTCSAGAHLAGTLGPTKLLPRGVQWHVEAHGNTCHNVLAACSSTGTSAPTEKAPCGP